MIKFRRKITARPGDSTVVWVGPLWFYIVLRVSGASKSTDQLWWFIILAAVIFWFFNNWEIVKKES
jgi:hypothetical protein